MISRRSFIKRALAGAVLITASRIWQPALQLERESRRDICLSVDADGNAILHEAELNVDSSGNARLKCLEESDERYQDD